MADAEAMLREIVALEESETVGADYHKAHRELMRRAKRAVRALDGDGAEEWEAAPGFRGQPTVMSRDGNKVAECADYHFARRIARLPALERAAREVDYQRAVGNIRPVIDLGTSALDALRAARKQEDQ